MFTSVVAAFATLCLTLSQARDANPFVQRGMQEAVCTATLTNGTVLEWDEGESLGSYIQNACQNSEQFPCYCTAAENDKIACPYCPFLTNASNIVCAHDGDSITFFDEFDVQQTCSCTYLGNNAIQTTCDPRDRQDGTCALERNVDKCEELTKYMNYDPDCECLNFCLGEFTGCCESGTTCTVSCPGTATEDDVVAGCQIDPSKPPVTAPPVVAPTPAPTVCMLQQNTQNCPTFVADQEPVEGCGTDGCYNYCDGEFANCCDVDDMSCTVTCTGPTASPSSITAGCRIPTEAPTGCLGFTSPCEDYSDCCSGRCIFGKCAIAIPTNTRQKLSTGRGGAANVSKDNTRRTMQSSFTSNEQRKVRGMTTKLESSVEYSIVEH